MVKMNLLNHPQDSPLQLIAETATILDNLSQLQWIFVSDLEG